MQRSAAASGGHFRFDSVPRIFAICAMPSKIDPALGERIASASGEIYHTVCEAIADGRGTHLETAITAIGYLAGTAMLRNSGVDFSRLDPGTPIFVDAVNEVGQDVVGTMLETIARGGQTGPHDLKARPAASVPPGHDALLSHEELMRRLMPKFEAILARHSIPADLAPFACAHAEAQIIIAGQAQLAPAIGKAIAVNAIVRASKTVPYFGAVESSPQKQEPSVTAPRGNSTQPGESAGVVSARKAARMFLAVLGMCLVAVLIFGLFRRFILKGQTVPGEPFGASVRAGDHIATLIQTREPAVPSLHPNPEATRFQLALFMQPVDGRSPGRKIPIRRDLRGADFYFGTRILGSDGVHLWLYGTEIFGVDLRTDKPVVAADLRRANPSLDDIWDQGRYEFDRRLRVTSHDYKVAFDIEPASLKGVPAGGERLKAVPETKPAEFLASGALLSPTEWFGVHSQAEIARDFRPDSAISKRHRAEPKSAARGIYRGQLTPADRGPLVKTMAQLGGDTFPDAALLCSADSQPMRLAGPDGFLLACASAAGMDSTRLVVRVDLSGKVIWKADTGIAEFSQILPDARSFAFIGKRPALPGKLPEAILVIINVESGAVSTCSLRQ